MIKYTNFVFVYTFMYISLHDYVVYRKKLETKTAKCILKLYIIVFFLEKSIIIILEQSTEEQYTAINV